MPPARAAAPEDSVAIGGRRVGRKVRPPAGPRRPGKLLPGTFAARGPRPGARRRAAVRGCTSAAGLQSGRAMPVRGRLAELLVAALAAVAGASLPGPAAAAPIAVRYAEGVTHGFLTLRNAAGETLAEGDLLQVVKPEGVDSRLVFRFHDGSVHDETVVFTQRKVFTVERYHLMQRGPTFPEQLEVKMERRTGRYEAR